MPLTWSSTYLNGNYRIASYNNEFTTPIIISNIASTVAGQIVLTWSGGLGNNVQYSYAIASTPSVIAAGTVISGTPTTTSSNTIRYLIPVLLQHKSLIFTTMRQRI